jgi:hypothetical protein
VAEARERSGRVIELGHRLGSTYRATFEGRALDVIWDRVTAGRIRGLSENYIQVSAPSEGRRSGELERVIYRAG